MRADSPARTIGSCLGVTGTYPAIFIRPKIM